MNAKKQITHEFLSALENAFYYLPESVAENTQKTIKALQKHGFNASEISDKKYVESLKLPFVVIPPEGDQHSWVKVESDADLTWFLEDYEYMEYELGDVKSIAVELVKEKLQELYNDMTAKEKAKQLVDSFMDVGEEQEYNTPRYLSKEAAKQCATKTVDELIEWVGDHVYMLGNRERGYHFWREVKQEIEKI